MDEINRNGHNWPGDLGSARERVTYYCVWEVSYGDIKVEIRMLDRDPNMSLVRRSKYQTNKG